MKWLLLDGHELTQPDIYYTRQVEYQWDIAECTCIWLNINGYLLGRLLILCLGDLIELPVVGLLWVKNGENR